MAKEFIVAEKRTAIVVWEVGDDLINQGPVMDRPSCEICMALQGSRENR